MARTLTRDGLHSLRLHAEYRKCIYCGRFISYDDMNNNRCGWYDPTGPSDWEPREPQPFHKTCQAAAVQESYR